MSTNTLEEGRRDGIGIMDNPKASCPDCGAVEVVRDNEKGELICAACGLVLSDHRIDTGPEWRAFNSEERDKKARTGSPSNYMIHDYGLSTVIDWRDRDSGGGFI